MKLIVSLAMLLLIGTASAQSQSANQQTNVRLFAQCMFTISDQAEMEQLSNDLKNSPYTEMVRLDWHTQRALIITQGLNTLSIDDFKSWFAEYESTVHCVQIGVYGVDVMDPYPFTNCQN
jgi:hypothetical protein